VAQASDYLHERNVWPARCEAHHDDNSQPREAWRASASLYSVEYYDQAAINRLKSMSSFENQCVELGSVEVSPHGRSFVLGLVGENREVHRLELPCWTVHQLMRLLPRLDAALLQARDEVAPDLIAYPVIEWAVEHTGADQSVALSLRTDRQVETAFLFAHEEASALHAALTQALDDATEPAPSRRPHRIGVAL